MTTPFTSRPPPWLLALALAASAGPAAAEPADELALRLISLRSEVEQLNTELTLLREEQRASLAGLNARKAELEASVERQRLSGREIAGKLQAAQDGLGEAGTAGQALVPQLLAAAAALRTHVEAGLPFKREERVSDLDQFTTQLRNGTLSPERAVNRLWAFYEDEFRMTRENGLHSQTIELDGERVLAEIAKLGNMVLYCRTRDGRIGQAVGTGGDWRFEQLTDGGDRARVEAVFDSLRKQIRQGYFELPLAAAGDAR
ncbi:MAG TPA: DUF3450 family protein [Xanthomonadaceae bacterium]|nr:DUF3450 family protein [Xanthomonadaceae bacterium]